MIARGPTPIDAAPQHGPRPLPLFLDMLRSETAASPERFATAMAGLRAFQEAPRELGLPPLPIRHRIGRVALRDGGGEGRPVVFIPSLINPPTILDFGKASLVRWMATRDCHAWLVDWGEPDEADRDLNLTAHVEHLLVPLLAMLDEPPVLVGYCLGGTLAVAAAATMPVAGLATLAAPWRFAGYGAARETMLAMWRTVEPACRSLGVLPMEVLQAGFWRLDPARTIAKYEAFGRMEAMSDAARAFIRLEDWANAGPPLPYAAARELFEGFVGEDRPGRGEWRVGGTAVNPSGLACPMIEFVSQTDRIVPAATAIGSTNRRDLAIGHVGMIVSGSAGERIWKPLADWIVNLP